MAPTKALQYQRFGFPEPAFHRRHGTAEQPFDPASHWILELIDYGAPSRNVGGDGRHVVERPVPPNLEAERVGFDLPVPELGGETEHLRYVVVQLGDFVWSPDGQVAG